MNHKGTQTIKTDRLILRRFKVSDAPKMFENWACDSEVAKYLTWPAHENAEFTKSLLADWTSRYEKPDYYNWCIEFKETHEPIGSISVVNVSEWLQTATVGYCIGKAYWGKGLTPEAFAAVIAFLFNEVGVNRIQADHHINNKASGKVMEKCGLKYEGTLRCAGRTYSGLCDICVYAILREDYR